MVSEVSQTDTVWFHLEVDSYRKQAKKKKKRKRTPRHREQICGWGQGMEMGEGSKKVQTSSYKVSHGNVMYSSVTIVNTACIFQSC